MILYKNLSFLFKSFFSHCNFSNFFYLGEKNPNLLYDSPPQGTVRARTDRGLLPNSASKPILLSPPVDQVMNSKEYKGNHFFIYFVECSSFFMKHSAENYILNKFLIFLNFKFYLFIYLFLYFHSFRNFRNNARGVGIHWSRFG